MEIQTKIKIPQSKQLLTHENTFFSIGSCFSENIGNKLLYLKFRGENNPFGTLFNPISIFKSIELLHTQQINKNRIIQNNDSLYYHLDFHSEFSNPDSQSLLEQIKNKLLEQKTAFENTDYLIITLGSAFVHEWNIDNQIVGNCHKIPQHNFTKKLLSLEEIQSSFREIEQYIHHFKKIIFTLSPVRHTKEGLSENQVSKSILRVFLHEITSQNPRYEYFPAFEIMMDELRDYRFYSEDMIHPSPLAIQYIFDLFIEKNFTEQTKIKASQIHEVQKMLFHKLLTTSSDLKKKFYLSIIEKIEKQNLSLLFNKEIIDLKKYLHD